MINQMRNCLSVNYLLPNLMHMDICSVDLKAVSNSKEVLNATIYVDIYSS